MTSELSIVIAHVIMIMHNLRVPGHEIQALVTRRRRRLMSSKMEDMVLTTSGIFPNESSDQLKGRGTWKMN